MPALCRDDAEVEVRWRDLVRHRDHRFEWTRAEFTAWCEHIHTRFGYGYRILPIGPEDAEVGAPTQMAIFKRPDA